MLKVSCQVLRASRDGACPASLSALAFPSIQLECLLVQASPLFLSLHHAALTSLALSPGYPPHRLGQLLWEPLDVFIIQAEQGQLPQVSALVASAWSLPSVLMSGWNLGTQRWRQCCAATVLTVE